MLASLLFPDWITKKEVKVMRKIRKVFVVGLMASVVLMVSLFLTSFTNTALARTHGEVILPDELVVGEVVTVYMGPTYGYQDALVIKEGFEPRLILLSNLGNDVFYAAGKFLSCDWDDDTNYEKRVEYRRGRREIDYEPVRVVFYKRGFERYETSNLRKQIDKRTAGHAPYIFNVRAPTVEDIVRNGELIVHRIAQGGSFWTYSLSRCQTTIGRVYVYIVRRGPNWVGRYVRVPNMWAVHSDGTVRPTPLLRDAILTPREFRNLSNAGILHQEVANYLGVRPVFNLKYYTVLRYDSETNTFRATTPTILGRYIYQAIRDINTATTNSDNVPPMVNLRTVSGARATSGTSIQAIVTVSDNTQGPFTYSINGDTFRDLPDSGIISLPVTNRGNNVITVRVKDAAGNIGSDTIVIRRL